MGLVACIARQRSVVETLRNGGQDTVFAERLLQKLLESQVLHERHRERLRHELGSVKRLAEAGWKCPIRLGCLHEQNSIGSKPGNALSRPSAQATRRQSASLKNKRVCG